MSAPPLDLPLGVDPLNTSLHLEIHEDADMPLEDSDDSFVNGDGNVDSTNQLLPLHNRPSSRGGSPGLGPLQLRSPRMMAGMRKNSNQEGNGESSRLQMEVSGGSDEEGELSDSREDLDDGRPRYEFSTQENATLLGGRVQRNTRREPELSSRAAVRGLAAAEHERVLLHSQRLRKRRQEKREAEKKNTRCMVMLLVTAAVGVMFGLAVAFPLATGETGTTGDRGVAANIGQNLSTVADAEAKCLLLNSECQISGGQPCCQGTSCTRIDPGDVHLCVQNHRVDFGSDPMAGNNTSSSSDQPPKTIEPPVPSIPTPSPSPPPSPSPSPSPSSFPSTSPVAIPTATPATSPPASSEPPTIPTLLPPTNDTQTVAPESTTLGKPHTKKTSSTHMSEQTPTSESVSDMVSGSPMVEQTSSSSDSDSATATTTKIEASETPITPTESHIATHKPKPKPTHHTNSTLATESPPTPIPTESPSDPIAPATAHDSDFHTSPSEPSPTMETQHETMATTEFAEPTGVETEAATQTETETESETGGVEESATGDMNSTVSGGEGEEGENATATTSPGDLAKAAFESTVSVSHILQMFSPLASNGGLMVYGNLTGTEAAESLRQNISRALGLRPHVFNDFCSGPFEQARREAAAFFAHVSKATMGLTVFEDKALPTNPYCTKSTGEQEYPCVEGKSYHGRGPMMLTGNEHYGQLSEFMYGNKFVLLEKPERVGSDFSLGWASALWLWTVPRPFGGPCPKRRGEQEISLPSGTASLHQAMEDVLGFGETINIIRGDMECCPNAPDRDVAMIRIQSYLKYAAILGVEAPKDGCGSKLNEWGKCDFGRGCPLAALGKCNVCAMSNVTVATEMNVTASVTQWSCESDGDGCRK